MGVPKFYRWLSERYPCLSEVIKENQIPEFDNLYFDLNGIIHNCSHPNDADPHFRISEEQIFIDIFHYIDVLFRIISPKKVLFMAVDGVAPRAKMNQQRSRRFRSAKEAHDQEKKAVEKGESLPSEKRFDTNCITPGTVFMDKLHQQLKYFVNLKVSTDNAWRNVRIFLSGHDCPGEGEHKIMDFIRSERSEPNYDPNTRHCLYGLDADLVMLGLITHEPHFSLLREEIQFGKKGKDQKPSPEETVFHLLHLSLLREYLDFEFSPLRETLTFQYDLEHIIDDWVMLGFLVGNDFIPNLPFMHINFNALPMLYSNYISVMPKLDGYINNGGTLCLRRFQIFLQHLASFDLTTFDDKIMDLRWLESKKGRKAIVENNSSLVGNELCGDQIYSDDMANFKNQESADVHDQAYFVEFNLWKREYYKDKFKLPTVDRKTVDCLCWDFVVAVEWNLRYYFNGCPSWGWFYQHHYSPFVSDIANCDAFVTVQDIVLDYGKPFLPFQQLLAVLPTLSGSLLPDPFHELMNSVDSPILDFYPASFESDLNGKQQAWEAVVLIPFIDESRLLDAMAKNIHRLSPYEAKRNSHGDCFLYQYDSDVESSYESPGNFPSISKNKVACTTVARNQFVIPVSKIKKYLLPGARVDVSFPGFPTLKHIAHKFERRAAGVKVFQHISRDENTLIIVDPKPKAVDEVAREYIGKSVFVCWPHLREALVVSVDSETRSFESLENENYQLKKTDSFSLQSFRQNVQGIEEEYKQRRGVLVGKTEVLLGVRFISGRRYTSGLNGFVTLKQEWSPVIQPVLFQTVVKDIGEFDPSYLQFKTLDVLFSVGTIVLSLDESYYGCQGAIMSVSSCGEGSCLVALNQPSEPDFTKYISQEKSVVRYHIASVASRLYNVSANILSRITGVTFIIEPDGKTKHNIGLNLKSNKNNTFVDGFTLKTSSGPWQYSDNLCNVVLKYNQQFPSVFRSMERNQNHLNATEAIGDNWKTVLAEIKNWVKIQECSSASRITTSVEKVDSNILENLLEVVRNLEDNPDVVSLSLHPSKLYRALHHQESSLPDPKTNFELLDRVVFCQGNHTVPFGSRGTVISIQKGDILLNSVVEVMFDEEFTSFSGKSVMSRNFKLSPSSLINVSYGYRVKVSASFPRLGTPNTTIKLLTPSKLDKTTDSNFSFNNVTTSSNTTPISSATNHGVMSPSSEQFYTAPSSFSGSTKRKTLSDTPVQSNAREIIPSQLFDRPEKNLDILNEKLESEIDDFKKFGNLFTKQKPEINVSTKQLEKNCRDISGKIDTEATLALSTLLKIKGKQSETTLTPTPVPNISDPNTSICSLLDHKLSGFAKPFQQSASRVSGPSQVYQEQYSPIVDPNVRQLAPYQVYCQPTPLNLSPFPATDLQPVSSFDSPQLLYLDNAMWHQTQFANRESFISSPLYGHYDIAKNVANGPSLYNSALPNVLDSQLGRLEHAVVKQCIQAYNAGPLFNMRHNDFNYVASVTLPNGHIIYGEPENNNESAHFSALQKTLNFLINPSNQFMVNSPQFVIPTMPLKHAAAKGGSHASVSDGQKKVRAKKLAINFPPK